METEFFGLEWLRLVIDQALGIHGEAILDAGNVQSPVPVYSKQPALNVTSHGR